MTKFPHAVWRTRHATFIAADSVANRDPVGNPDRDADPRPPGGASVNAALVFAFQGERFVIGDIIGRGWCIPGGRLEAGESPEAAARREAWEETGAVLGPLRPIGYFLLTDPDAHTSEAVPTFLATAVRLESLPPGSESRGVRLARFEELPTCYYLWDSLIEAVFRYASDLHSREMPGR